MHCATYCSSGNMRITCSTCAPQVTRQDTRPYGTAEITCHDTCAFVLQEKTALVKSLQAAAAAAIRRASEEGGSARSGSMDGSQRAIIRDLSQKVSDLCRELADARRQQHLAQASCSVPNAP